MPINVRKIQSIINNNADIIYEVNPENQETFLNYILNKKSDFELSNDYFETVQLLLEKMSDKNDLLFLNDSKGLNSLYYLIKYHCLSEKSSNIIGKDLLINIVSNLIKKHQETYNESYISTIFSDYNNVNNNFTISFNNIDPIFLNIIENKQFPTILKSSLEDNNIINNQELFSINLINTIIQNSINDSNQTVEEKLNLTRNIIILNGKDIHDQINDQTKELLISLCSYQNEISYPIICGKINMNSLLSKCYLDLHIKRNIRNNYFLSQEQIRTLIKHDIKYMIQHHPIESKHYLNSIFIDYFNNNSFEYFIFNKDQVNNTFDKHINNILSIFNDKDLEEYQFKLIDSIQSLKLQSYNNNYLTFEKLLINCSNVNYFFEYIYNYNNNILIDTKFSFTNDESIDLYNSFAERKKLEIITKDNLINHNKKDKFKL